MGALITEPNIKDPDGFYAELVALQEGAAPGAGGAEALNARLVLILANHIGDRDTLRQAFDLAARAGGRPEKDRTGAD